MPTHTRAFLLPTVEAVAAQLGVARAHADGRAPADPLPAPGIQLGRRLVVSGSARDRLLAREVTLPAGSGDEVA